MNPSTDTRAGRIRRNHVRLAIWSFGWTATMAVATFGPNALWARKSPLTVLAILVNAAFGVGMILANKRYLEGLDELQRKIQYEAMALALGVGVVGGLSYSVLDITDVIGPDAEIGFLVIGISLTYLAGLGIARARYR